jgi:hypothetical protein
MKPMRKKHSRWKNSKESIGTYKEEVTVIEKRLTGDERKN